MPPCDGSYMNPTHIEANRKKVSELIVFVDSQLKIDTPADIKNAAKDYYGEGVDLDTVTEMLCSKLSKLTKKQQDEIIYNGRNKSSRALANWWEEHLAADKARIEEELKAKKTKAARAAAIKKLTPHERKLLDLEE